MGERAPLRGLPSRSVSDRGITINDLDDISQYERVDEKPKKRERVVSLDAFRGLVIAVMVLVDDAGDAYNVINHSPWNNITLADFVMPYFLFIVGVAIAITQSWKEGPKEARLKRIVWRAFKLFVLGIICQGSAFPEHPSLIDLSRLRFCGILQRISFAYLVVAPLEVIIRPRELGDTPFRVLLRFPWHIVIPLAFTVLYLILIFGTYVPGCGRGRLDPECNAAGYIDKIILTQDHMYPAPEWTRLNECSSCSPASCPRDDAPSWCWEPFDPEGITTTFGTPLSAALGLYFGHILKEYSEHRQRLVQMAFPSCFLVILGLAVHFTFMPMNKQLWSLSYVLFMGGTSGFCLMFFYIICDLLKAQWVVLPFIWTGMNAIFIFLGAASDFLEAFIQWFWWRTPDRTLIYAIHHYLFDSWLSPAPAQLVYVLCKIGFWFVIAWYLARTGRFYTV